ncbi:hypothetical protein BpHYR1_048747 [Brachionus plicatilis]|uniref:Uncharacterized protein n=1 Tax=Brachionus plicatilis TaxID=10195 RepID=A0A3M7Q0U3_BRAPC|nr:hypothetical protein BpHYR1_048747 [Brachionus plicatilis]
MTKTCSIHEAELYMRVTRQLLLLQNDISHKWDFLGKENEKLNQLIDFSWKENQKKISNKSTSPNGNQKSNELEQKNYK